MKKIIKNNLPLISIILGIVLGCVIGVVYPQASNLEFLGTIYANLMFCVCVPLIFFSISSSIAKHKNDSKNKNIVGITILTFVITSFIATVLVYLVVCVIPISNGEFTIPSGEVASAVDIPSMIVDFLTQSDFNLLLSKKSLLPLIIAAIFFGTAIKMSGEKGEYTLLVFQSITSCLMNVVKIINYFAPIGLFGMFASLINKYGPTQLGDYGKIFALDAIVGYVYLFLMILVCTAISGNKDNLNTILKHIYKPFLVGFGTRSSIASMPTNIEQANDSGIPKDVIDIVMPLGSTMHMNGSAMSAIYKVAFLFAIFGRDIISIEGLSALIVCTLVSIAIPGIPSGGNIGSMIICSVFFPNDMVTAFVISKAIGAILDPISTSINVSMDYIVSFAISRIVKGKDWKKKTTNESETI